MLVVYFFPFCFVQSLHGGGSAVTKACSIGVDSRILP